MARKSVYVFVRMSPEEKEALRTAARRRDVGQAELARQLVATGLAAADAAPEVLLTTRLLRRSRHVAASNGEPLAELVSRAVRAELAVARGRP